MAAVVVVVTAVVGIERVVELPPLVAGDPDGDADAADDADADAAVRVPLGVWLGETLPLVAVGVPGAADVPGGDGLPPVVGGVSVVVPANAAPVAPGDFVVTTAIPTAMTTVMTTAAQTPRCANNRRPRTITLRLPFSR